MRILVADDDRPTRLVATRVLAAQGHDVVEAADGAAACAILERQTERCIAVLDWMMPEPDGIELCRRIAARRDGPFVYTILLTARDGRDDKLTALEAGAHSFLSKPIDAAELTASVAVARRVLDYDRTLAEKNRELQSYATDLERLAEERSKQLVHADRMATLGLLAAGVAHEVNNPAAFVSGNVQTMEKAWPAIDAVLRAAIAGGHEQRRMLEFARDQFPDMFGGIRKGVARIQRITQGLKSYARRDAGRAEPFDLAASIDSALELVHNRVAKCAAVEVDIPQRPVIADGDHTQIEQVLINLIVNAADAMRDVADARLRISMQVADGCASIAVDDNGPGIPADQIEQVFRPFFTTKAEGEGTGLGLSISQGIVDQHGGTLSVANRPEGGVRFTLRIPARPGPIPALQETAR